MSRTRNPQDALRLRNAELVARLADADGPEPDALVEELVLNNLEVARSIARRYVGRSESAHEAGVGVPGRLSVAGFDDSELSEFVHPALTTVRADPFAFGEAAARTLNLLIDGEGPVADVELPPARLVVRRSTAAPASQ